MTSQTKSKHSEIIHTKELYNLCNRWYCNADEEERFDWIRHWLETNKNDGDTLKTALTYQGQYNYTPLHHILCKQSLLEIIQLDIIQTIIKHAPEGLNMKNYGGRLPIHHACIYGASLEVIQALLTASPDTIKVRDNYGQIPLHLACQNDVSLDVLNFLIKSYPEGVDHKNKGGFTPLDDLKQKMYAEKKDDSGMLPLHHACNNGYSLHLIHFLIQAYPESTTVQDNDGNTPWQYLAKAASRVDERGMLLLHREVAHYSGLNVELLPILFHANPEAIRLQDKWGLLPLHHASLNKASPLEALILLVKLYPEGVLV